MAMNTVKTTWVAVADGEKALLFRNDDTDAKPILNVLRKEEIDNAPRREQAANRRGRMQDYGAGRAQRSAVEDTDWHELGKERFAMEFADILNRAALRNAFDRLVLIAPPQALGRLRPELRDEVIDRIAAEETSDLTNHPVEEIEEHVGRLFPEPEPDYEADLRRKS
jgi:protein required for attachment to host cells